MEKAVKINEIPRPYKDANFDFMVRDMERVGVGCVVLRVKPSFVGARIRKVIVVLGVTQWRLSQE